MKRFDKSDYETLKSIIMSIMTTIIVVSFVPFTFDNWFQAIFTYITMTFCFMWMYLNIDCYFDRKEVDNNVLHR